MVMIGMMDYDPLPPLVNHDCHDVEMMRMISAPPRHSGGSRNLGWV